MYAENIFYQCSVVTLNCCVAQRLKAKELIAVSH